MNSEIVKKVLESKRVQGVVVAILLILFREKLNIPITEEQLTYVVGLVVSLVIGDSLRPIVPKQEPKSDA